MLFSLTKFLYETFTHLTHFIRKSFRQSMMQLLQYIMSQHLRRTPAEQGCSAEKTNHCPKYFPLRGRKAGNFEFDIDKFEMKGYILHIKLQDLFQIIRLFA